jgi:hypothetical protein
MDKGRREADETELCMGTCRSSWNIVYLYNMAAVNIEEDNWQFNID